MADLRISELAALAGVDLAASDLLPVADVSASETKKITVSDFTGKAVTLIADATIPGAKILFGSSQVPGTALIDGGVSTAKLADDAVSAAKLGDESTVDLVTSLPASGAFIGQLALDTTTLKVTCWDGTQWRSIKAAGSINSVTGSSVGVVNITVTTSGDAVTIATTLDNTTNAAEFLAGPASSGGAVGYRSIIGTDLPTASSSSKGGVVVNGNGLTMSGDTLAIDNSVTASGSTYGVVQYNAKGLVTDGRAITGSDLPLATVNSIGGIRPDVDLTVNGTGVLSHANSITAGTATKVTYDSKGHITGASTLATTDIPDLPASKITSGSLDIGLIGNNAISGSKLADSSTVKFGGSSSTANIVTFPAAEFQGQFFLDALNGDLYLYDGSAWQPITITAGELVYAGTYDASLNQVKSLTAAGTAAGLVINTALPAASNSNLRYYLVVSDGGTGIAPAPATSLSPPDMIVSNGTTWDLIDVSNAVAGQTANNISFTPTGDLSSTNVQTALQELDNEKLPKAGGAITGELRIATGGTFCFEGSVDDQYETFLAVVNPTADRTITFPDASGTVVFSGAISNTDIVAGAGIVDTKLATITTSGKVANSATTATDASTPSTIVSRDASGNFSASTITATSFVGSGASLTSLGAGSLTGTIPSAVLGNSSLNIGTTSIALNRSSANQALTGISSLAMPGATSGTITVLPSAVAGTTTITYPATTGTLITTGDSGTVTNTMLAGSIADSKLSTISTAGKVSNSATTATNANTASAIVARDASGNFAAGTISAALSGNASTATTLQTARNIQGVSFNGSADITVVTAGTGISVTGTAVANTGVLSVNGNTGAVTNVAVTNAAQSFSAAQRGTVSALGNQSGTITLDMATANNFSLTLNANATNTLANPSNLTAGQSGTIVITQDATGSRLLAYGANWKWPSGTAPILTTTPNAVDVIAYYVESATRITARLISDVK